MNTADQYLNRALQQLKVEKPNDRSERDRCIAVAITDLQHIIAWYALYCAPGDTPRLEMNHADPS